MRCFNEAAGIPRGRLEHFAERRAFVRGASMRPRVFPAEDDRIRHRIVAPVQASMRPRVFPAEDPRKRVVHMLASKRFNEAAGIPRGRQAPHVSPVRQRHASMRPRVFPAEDSSPRSASCRDSAGFNEAAGIPRGRPAKVVALSDALRRLQ